MYGFLGPDESLPMIIASNLDQDQEKKLLNLLKRNEEFTTMDHRGLKGISPTIV